MFKSEPESIETKEQKEEKQQEEAAKAVEAATSALPGDVQRTISILESGDLKSFVSSYIQGLQGDSQNLVGFLNSQYDTTDKTVFEFLFNLHKAKAQTEWNLHSFFTTIANLGNQIQENGSPNFYLYLMLTSKETPKNSPIYGLAQNLNPDQDLNAHFTNI